MQLNLLNSEDNELEINISGLTYIPDFISAQDQDFLFCKIDQQPWLTDLKQYAQGPHPGPRLPAYAGP
jgi:hypothetical protein